MLPVCNKGMLPVGNKSMLLMGSIGKVVITVLYVSMRNHCTFWFTTGTYRNTLSMIPKITNNTQYLPIVSNNSNILKKVNNDNYLWLGMYKKYKDLACLP